MKVRSVSETVFRQSRVLYDLNLRSYQRLYFYSPDETIGSLLYSLSIFSLEEDNVYLTLHVSAYLANILDQ
jgi:hypothetical protein